MRPADAFLLLLLLVVFWSLLRLHQNRTIEFNLIDLILEGGRVSKVSCLVMGAFLVTSWILIRLTLDGKLTEGYFAGYGALWVAPLIARMFSTPPQPSMQSTTEIKQTTTEVK